MTHTIPTGTPRSLTATAFGVELQKALDVRGVSQNELARVIGCGHTTLWHYRFGRTLPKVARATEMAVALDWPKLRTLVLAARTRVCRRVGCGGAFINDIGSEAKRYCSLDCLKVQASAKQAESRARRAGQTGSHQARRAHVQRLRAAVRHADERAGRLTAAVAAMCAACEPEGLCRDAVCPLRAVSPLPLRAAAIGTPRQEVALRIEQRWTPAHREAQSRVTLARWERPGERERMGEMSRAMHAARTPEERETWRGRVGLAGKTDAERSAIVRKGQATRKARKAVAS